MFVNEITLVVIFDDKAVCLTCAVNVQFYPQMKQSSSGQIRASLPNGPSLPAHPVPRGPAVRPPCIPPLLTNGPLPPSVANNHTPGTRANGDVPYLHPNTLPHNCTSPGDTRKSQHLHSAQVRSYTTPVHGVMTSPPPASVRLNIRLIRFPTVLERNIEAHRGSLIMRVCITMHFKVNDQTHHY